MNIKPLGTNVIVIPEEQKTKTESGILVYKEDKDREQWGIVHAVGSAVDRSVLDVGDYVMYERFSGSLVQVDGKDYLIMDKDDIIAKQYKL